MKRTRSGTTLRGMLGWALLLPLAVLVTTGCFRIEMSFVVNDDGSGVVAYTIGTSDEFTALTDSSGGELDEEGLPPGAVAREYSEDGYTGYVITVPFTDYAEIRPVLTEFHQEGDFEIDLPDISQDENGDWRFSMTSSSLISEDDGSGDLLDIDPLMAGFLADGWFRVRAKLPGEIAEHNADRVENGELVWQIDFDPTEADSTEAREQFTARTTTGGGLPVIAIGAAAAVAIIALAAVAVLFFTRRGSAGRTTS